MLLTTYVVKGMIVNELEGRISRGFEPEFGGLSVAVQDELLAQAKLLERFGPELGRPHADTMNGSVFPNMKELRFRADNGVWRVAFAFDPDRQAVLLVGGDNSGGSEQRFYKQLIRKADERFGRHLARFKGKTTSGK